jgi:hypothetical protein
MFRDIIAVYCENRSKHINTLFGKMVEFYVLQRVVNIFTTWI